MIKIIQQVTANIFASCHAGQHFEIADDEFGMRWVR